MSIENPPIFNTSIFNDLAFEDFSDGLSLEEADNRYLKLTGGFLSGTLSLKDNLLITRTSNGEALTATNGTVSVGLHLLSSNSHIGTTSNHAFNIQANSNNVLQIQTGGSISVLNGGVITSGTTHLNSTNTLSNSNFRISIDSVSGNIDLRNNNSTNPTLLSLFANGSRQLTLINNANIVNIVNHNGSTGGLSLNGTLITATATELNVLDGVTASTAELNILDGVTASTAELNILDGVTASTAELNILDGVTASTAELNILDGVTASTAELNILDGVTASTAELNILDGVTATTSDLNGISGYSSYLTSITSGIVTASKAIVVDSSKNISGFNNMKLQNYGKFYVNSDLSNEVYITSSVNNDIIAYSDSISSGCFKFQNPSYGASPLFASGSMLRLINGHTSFNLEFNYNSSWDFKSSGSSYDIMISPNGTMALDCLATDSTVNIPIGLRLNKATGSQTTLFDAKGSNSYLDGSYNRFLRFEGANANPVIFELQVHSGAASTASNAAYFGTISANQLRFGTDNSTRMCITETGRVGIGTNSPAANLSVSGSTNITLGVSLQTVYQFDVGNGSSTITNLGSAPVTTAVSATFSSFINCSGIKQVSDGRLKTNIKNLDLERAKKLYNINAVNYNWIKDPNGMAEIGVIAQDVMDQGLIDLVAFSIDEELKADDKVLKDGVALNMRYDRITCYLLELVKDQNNRINKLENIIANLDIVEE